jgi:DNA polymerase III alpha subunit
MNSISVESFNKIINNQFKKFPFQDDPRYQFRLRYELLEIETQNCCDYFIELVRQRKKFPNENNLLVPVLLGICNEYNIEEMPKTKTNEFPDVDVDFLADVRDYLKNEFTPSQYKAENTCSIGTYGRYALKSAMIDMARIYGYDRQEVLNITTNLRMKDEDGDELTYEEALEMYPELKSYMDKYPELALAVQKLLHRVRNTGKHAGGVIVAKDEINKFVPLMKTTGGDQLVSQFVEGLATQELGPIGLVKFDLLVVSALEQAGHAAKMIKDRHGIKVICGTNHDWDKTDYLNDDKAISYANEADLIGIFQYDSNGIREVVKASGINSFDDLVAIVSLYRPGPLNAEMDQVFIKRKTGQEEYVIHPVLDPILKSTYGVLVYQEQVMRLLNVVGKIPLKDCEAIRKAISKKKVSTFVKYKEQFIENGMSVLGTIREEVTEIWKNLEFFSAYGFNRSHAVSYTFISSRQLYLKAYYPLEFFTALLMLEANEEKKRIYITDAQNHGIEVRVVDLNKSKANFSIHDNAIYIGFGNIKGIGMDTANKIVALQPFKDVDDFLRRFGTDSSVLKALIPLKVFGEDIKKAYNYWQSFMSKNKKVIDKNKRSNKSYLELKKTVLSLLPEKYWNLDLSEELFTILKSIHDSADVNKLYKKWIRINSKEEAKIEISYEDFDDDDMVIEDKEVLLELNDICVAERKHYGFQFTCRLKMMKMYNDNCTFDRVISSHAMGATKHMVQVEVLDVNKRYSKSGKPYCQLVAMDSNFRVERINVWEDDYSVFKHLLEVNKCLSMQVKPPSNGFSTYSLNSPPKHRRHLLPSSEMDFRIVLID